MGANYGCGNSPEGKVTAVFRLNALEPPSRFGLLAGAKGLEIPVWGKKRSL
jgi:hypothetical protein